MDWTAPLGSEGLVETLICLDVMNDWCSDHSRRACWMGYEACWACSMTCDNCRPGGGGTGGVGGGDGNRGCPRSVALIARRHHPASKQR